MFEEFSDVMIECPVLALWSQQGALPAWYDVLDVWRQWADDVRGRPFDYGHFLPEEAPDETWRELRAFFAASRSQQNVD